MGELYENGYVDWDAVWRTDSCRFKTLSFRWPCSLSPPGEYGWTIPVWRKWVDSCQKCETDRDAAQWSGQNRVGPNAARYLFVVAFALTELRSQLEVAPGHWQVVICGVFKSGNCDNFGCRPIGLRSLYGHLSIEIILYGTVCSSKIFTNKCVARSFCDSRASWLLN